MGTKKKMAMGGEKPASKSTTKTETRADEKRAAASMGKRKTGGSAAPVSYKKGGSTKKK
jgi:hypothetical protein